MFTIKCYTQQGRCIIRPADSFTILRDDRTGEAEITLHQASGPVADSRVDIVPADQKRPEGWPPAFQWAYIVNRYGQTVESVHLKGPCPTIAELEAILNSEDDRRVDINPDGTVHVSEPMAAV